MRKSYAFLAAALATALSGCASFGPTDPAQLRHESDRELCLRYADIRKPYLGDFVIDEQSRLDAIETVLRERHPDWPWQRIQEERVRVGMDADAVICSWGPPRYRNISSSGEQWVYGGGGGQYGQPKKYLYISAGKLSGFN